MFDQITTSKIFTADPSYTTTTLDALMGSSLTIVDTTDLGDFVVMNALSADGKRVLCIQGVLHGAVILMPDNNSPPHQVKTVAALDRNVDTHE